MEVVVITGAISRAKLRSNRHHQQTNTQLFTAHSVRALSENSLLLGVAKKLPLFFLQDLRCLLKFLTEFLPLQSELISAHIWYI